LANGDLAARNSSIAFIHRFGALINRAADSVSMPVCESSLTRDSHWSANCSAALNGCGISTPIIYDNVKPSFDHKVALSATVGRGPNCEISPCDREGRLSGVLLTFVS
jgi:hypothetical protein